MAKKLYVSFGENCLTDRILYRYGLKLLVTPYAHSRSNIEYILQIEDDNYKKIITRECFQYELTDGKLVVKLKRFNPLENHYNNRHADGFEFTHHDILASDKVFSKIIKRVNFFLKLRRRKKLIILYHHVLNFETDATLLIKNLSELKNIYKEINIGSEVVLFKQKIVQLESERAVDYEYVNGLHIYTFNTLRRWCGKDSALFWGEVDDDLIKNMIEEIKKL